jgi:hypothetical protein
MTIRLVGETNDCADAPMFHLRIAAAKGPETIGVRIRSTRARARRGCEHCRSDILFNNESTIEIWCGHTPPLRGHRIKNNGASFGTPMIGAAAWRIPERQVRKTG